VAKAVAGAKAVCSRCQKVWTVPEDVGGPAPPPTPLPSRRPLMVKKQSSSSAGIVAGVVGALLAVGIVVFMMSSSGGEPPGPPPAKPVVKAPPAPLPPPDPPLRAPRTEDVPNAPINLPPPPAPPPPPPAEPRQDVLANASLQAELDLLIYRINTTGLTARVLEVRGKPLEAKPLIETMKGFISDLDKFLAKLEREGIKRHRPDHLHPEDKITHLDTHDFAKLGAEGSEKVLVRFLGGLKAGSRAKLTVRRGDDFAFLEIIYHDRPKELYSIIQVAGIIPGQGSDLKEPETAPARGESTAKKVPEALKILTDALLRLPAADRERAAMILRGAYAASRAPAVLFTSANYLSFPDEAQGIDADAAKALQDYFNAVNFLEVEAFDRPRHLAALEDLKSRIPLVKAKSPGAADLLLRFAAAHAADSGAPEADVLKASEGLGLKRTADDKRWGDALSVLKADVASEILSGRPKDAWKRFDETLRHHDDFGVRLLGAWLLAVETFSRNNGGYDRLAAGFRYIGKEQPAIFASHADALAEGVEAAAKCSKCKGGSIACPKCGGDRKLDIDCKRCEGTGRYEKGGGSVMCRECNGKGKFFDVSCTCMRTSGQVDCPDCKGKEWKSQVEKADVAMVATLNNCDTCRGLGLPPVGLALTCRSCFGLGKYLVPKADAKKTLK
jgi:hypothetical protein